MKNNIQISIPNPCTENWSAMQPNTCGRFCNTCQKTVTDFTQMSDDAFITYFQNTKNVSCGRFTDRQLQLEIPAKSISFFSFGKIAKYAAVSLFTAAGLSGKVFGQKVEISQTENETNKLIEKPVAIDDSEYEIVKGEIVDIKNAGIANAIVFIPNFDIHAITDVDGNFQLQIKRDPKIVYYDLQVFTYEDRFWPLYRLNIYTHSSITIIKEPESILRTATVGGVSIYKPSKWQRFKKWIKTNFL